MKGTTTTAVKFAAFAAVMLMILLALVVVFGQMRFGPTNVYTARFTSASGLRPGEVVRIAGVDVGGAAGDVLKFAAQGLVPKPIRDGAAAVNATRFGDTLDDDDVVEMLEDIARGEPPIVEMVVRQTH